MGLGILSRCACVAYGFLALTLGGMDVGVLRAVMFV